MSSSAPTREFFRGWGDYHRSLRPRASSSTRPHLLRAIKAGLLLGGAATLLLVLLWGGGAQRDAAIPEEGGSPVRPRNEMTGARLVGVDGNGRRYEITAHRAFENRGEEALVRLDNLRAVFYARDGSEISLVASHGLYDTPGRRVAMTGGIEMTTRSGTSLATESAEYDVAGGIVHGVAPVSIRGPWGELDAGGFRYNPEQGILDFVGRPVFRIRRPETP